VSNRRLLASEWLKWQGCCWYIPLSAAAADMLSLLPKRLLLFCFLLGCGCTLLLLLLLLSGTPTDVKEEGPCVSL